MPQVTIVLTEEQLQAIDTQRARHGGAPVLLLALVQPQVQTVEPSSESAPALPSGLDERLQLTRIAALIAVWVALLFTALRRAEQVLAPGETGVILLLAADRAQAQIALRYIEGIIDAIPMLAAELRERQKERLRFDRIEIRVGTSNYRSVRGPTYICVVADELALWPADETSVNPDEETLAAVRPGLATVPESLLICVSTPYAKKGLFWRTFDENFGKDTPGVLVVQAPSRVLNPMLPQSVVDRALREDEPHARAEYLAEFRSDVESFVSREVLMECVVPDRGELPAMRHASYKCFTDAAGGSGGDSWTLAVAHKEKNGRIVVDALRERRPPFSPQQVAQEFAAVAKYYRVGEITGDRFSGGWVAEAFAQCGLRYVPCSEPKSALYSSLLPALNNRLCELPDAPRMISQLLGLERTTAKGGRDVIDHGKNNSHDDLSNAVAGAIWLCSQKVSVPVFDCGRHLERFEPGGEVVFTMPDGTEIARADRQHVKQVRDIVLFGLGQGRRRW
jgi:hypothetical protein